MERLILGFATLLLVTPSLTLQAQDFGQPPSDRLAMAPAEPFESNSPALSPDISVEHTGENDLIDIAATEAMAKNDVLMFADQQADDQPFERDQPSNASNMFLPIILLFGSLSIAGLAVCIVVHLRNHPVQPDRDIIAE